MEVATAAARVKHHLRYAAAIVGVGAAAGAFAIAFRGAMHLLFAHLYGAVDVLEAFNALPAALRVLVPVAGGAAAATLGVIAARRAGGHGVAEILEAVVLGRGRVSARTTLWKALGSFAALATGGSVGREGPLLQFGAAAGSAAGDHFAVGPKRARALVAAGTAAGFAAAYNTPIAAVLFVLEVVTGLITLEVVLPVVVATAIATWLTRLALGGGPLYGLRLFSLVSGRELGAYAVLGVLTGLVGPAFMSLLSTGTRAFRRVPLPAGARGALGGLVVGLLALQLPEVTGNGYEAIQLMLDARYGVAMLGLLLVAKALATTASVSSGSPGGVFTPSLFLGAATGGIVGAVVHLLLPSHGFLGGYVLVGMAGAIAATTHAPVMATVLGFELSGDYAIVVPLFVATVLATVVARRLRADSIYTEELRRRGIAWEGTLTQRLARAARARDIFEQDPYVVAETDPLAVALERLARTRARVVFVTGGAHVRAIDLHLAAEHWSGGRKDPPDATCGAVAVPVPAASPDDDLLVLSEKLFDVDWGEIPVVDAAVEPGRPIGVVTRRALLAAFDRELLDRDLLYTRVVWFEGQHASADYLELPRGYRVEVIAPPASAVGGAVDAAALRARAGVIVLGVRRAPAGAPPEWLAAESIERTAETDRWMVVGPAEAITRLRGGV
jgi:CIC family chloride channel protein